MSALTIRQQMLGTRSELALVVFMIGILLVLFTPIPSALLDFLLLINMSFALLILMLTFYMDKPLSFSTFPSVLLMATLFRLSLNIAATRLILSDADAGEVIGAVGNYVVGGNYVIGMVVFFILIIVQYVVVTNGAQRVAEVAARFTLDSMPGKQMAIDADLNMGMIDEIEARARRENVEREANFYGSMDGASKFVKGDAIAGILIILIDIIGGLTVGIAQLGMSWADALETYTLLTVGDGIVTQVPALIVSTATGIIVTRAATDAHLSEEITNQVAKYPKSLIMLSIGLFLFLLLPGIPTLPVLMILTIVLAGSYFAFQRARLEQSSVLEDTSDVEEEDDTLYQSLNIDPIVVRVGVELSKEVERPGSVILERIKLFRRQFAEEVGLVIPGVRIQEDENLDSAAYELRISDSSVGSGSIYLDRMLAISPKVDIELPEGIETKDPTYGLPAVWMERDSIDRGEAAELTLVEPVTVLYTHFSETVRRHAHELMSRSETDRLLAKVKAEAPSLYEDLIPNILTVSEVQKVLQLLLAEKVPIRNIARILEGLIDAAGRSKDPERLADEIRIVLGRAICETISRGEGALSVLSLGAPLEHLLQRGLRTTEEGVSLFIDPRTSQQVILEIGKATERMMQESNTPVLMCSKSLRRPLKKLLSRVLPHVAVLSLNEVPDTLPVASAGLIELDEIAMANDQTDFGTGSLPPVPDSVTSDPAPRSPGGPNG